MKRKKNLFFQMFLVIFPSETYQIFLCSPTSILPTHG